MIGFDGIPEIYIVQGCTDLRKGIDGYARIVQGRLGLDPFKDAMFVFCNRHRDKIKCLYWDGDGFWLLCKRLEEGRFEWPAKEEEAVSITHGQLKRLLEGLESGQEKVLKKKSYKYA